MTSKCECSDHGCPVCKGKCETGYGLTVLYRVDMEDETGTLFCEECAADAMSSGLFTDEPNDENYLEVE